jgi:hypothetical protein
MSALPPIDAEYRQAKRNATRDTVDLLRGLGVPGGVLYGLATDYPMYGVARIETFDSGFYDSSDDGEMAIIQPVAQCVESGSPDVIDLVTWLPDDPAHWWLRIGHWPLLNPDAVSDATFFGEDNPVVVHAMPLDFIRAGCEGVVVLQWTAGLPFYFGAVRKLLAMGADTGRRLQECFDRQIPEIRYSEARHAA